MSRLIYRYFVYEFVSMSRVRGAIECSCMTERLIGTSTCVLLVALLDSTNYNENSSNV